MKTDPPDSSPAKLVLKEIDALLQDQRELLAKYSGRLETELVFVRSKVEPSGREKKLSGARIRDLRDMLTLLNQRKIRPEKGRRKDLKRIEGLIRDLGMLVENW